MVCRSLSLSSSSPLEKGVGRCIPERGLFFSSQPHTKVSSEARGGRDCSHSHGSREWRRKSKRRRRDRDKSGLGLGAASPWAGLGQVQGASVARGGGEERDYTLSFCTPFVSPPSNPCRLVHPLPPPPDTAPTGGAEQFGEKAIPEGAGLGAQPPPHLQRLQV